MQADPIETPRLILRKMEAGDFDALFKIFTDPKVMASFGNYLFTPDDMHGWLQRNLDHQQQYGYGLFAVIDKTSGELIGDCGLENLEEDGQITATELGYDFRSEYWNQGLASEAARAVRDFAFHQLGLPRLISLIRVGNQASRRVAEKTGMRLKEEIRRYERDYWVYEVISPRR